LEEPGELSWFFSGAVCSSILCRWRPANVSLKLATALKSVFPAGPANDLESPCGLAWARVFSKQLSYMGDKRHYFQRWEVGFRSNYCLVQIDSYLASHHASGSTYLLSDNAFQSLLCRICTWRGKTLYRTAARDVGCWGITGPVAKWPVPGIHSRDW
jgi:hypothetical protein